MDSGDPAERVRSGNGGLSESDIFGEKTVEQYTYTCIEVYQRSKGTLDSRLPMKDTSINEKRAIL